MVSFTYSSSVSLSSVSWRNFTSLAGEFRAGTSSSSALGLSSSSSPRTFFLIGAEGGTGALTVVKELLNPPFLKPPPLPPPPGAGRVPAPVATPLLFVSITLNPASASAFFSARLAFSAAFGSRDSCFSSCRRLRCW